ncbi:MAG TPA: decaprenyl-phosphate phosphoribosyltransferase [Candidatus Hydrogenedentes bacterium]|nr:decaprenyl-phosphate phosphoribosyltransferase [Candidatus Hydrogenedentota bacterium]HOR51220.1 decaprenyl-phosphate phosphoribosyltransferase [Candidatus Hydrogenedentota bacterium]HPK25104.1 decaprenyl-phosphate phosphoribosyltransferase [Candidatus Hydrogenedentota bacterium]HPX86721.1 decaprenyl-phosphate phosphoribosyltransferase [Candidatus Hydrogenedentota bacterium]HQB02440.1 decaprenyl-phosphate phosphoribosyltransferase [Candidatus Hydrogenedentota bacterium]
MGRFSDWIRLLRVYQWTKNALVLMPLVFAQQLLNPEAAVRSLLATVAFCLASSATYIVNDLRDRESDRNHPTKRMRPLASDAVAPVPASLFSAALLVLSLALAFHLNWAFLLSLLTYLALTASYSFFLKDLFIVDVIAVALGFVVRAIAGAVVIDVVFSNWLIVCTLFLALFLGLGKRRGEIALLEEDAADHREVLHHYSIDFIDKMLIVVAGGAMITFTIYTCSPEVVSRIGTDKLYMTLPFVIYGLARYLWLVEQNETGDPSQVLLKDLPTCVAVLLWAITCALIIYS